MNETTAYDDQLTSLRAQAEEARAQGDLQTARQIWEAILQLAPDDQAAAAGLREAGEAAPSSEASFELAEDALQPDAGAEGPSPASDPELDLDVDLDLDLDLDLELDQPPAPQRAPVASPEPPAAPAQAPPAQAPVDEQPSSSDDGSTTVADLFMAAEELDGDAERWQGPPGDAAGAPDEAHGVDADEGEAALLVTRAREAMQQGHLDQASDLAARAMMLRDDAPGAQQLLDEIREARERDAGGADRLLTEAAEDLEAGRVEQAIARLESALELVPEHPEVLDQLERARDLQRAGTVEEAPPARAAEEPPAEADDHDDDEWSSMPAIPLARRPAPPPTPPREEPSAGEEEMLAGQGPHAGTAASTGGHEPPPGGAPGPGEPPPPPPPPREASGPRHEPPPPPPPEPPPPPAPAQQARPAAGARKGATRRARVSSVDRRTGALAAILVMLALGAGGWYAWSWWSGSPGGRGGTALSAAAAGPQSSNGAGPAATTPASTREAQTRSDAAPSRNADERLPRPSDVPALLERAGRLTRDGRYEQALAVLEAAREADPSRFEVLDQLERVRRLARERRDALERVAMGRDLFESGSYREALRLFYRIPAKYRPKDLPTWIANGWYNLGVQALQAGSLVEARRFFADSLELRPGDPMVRRHQELVQRYRGRTLDEIYWAYVNRLDLRPLPARAVSDETASAR